MKCRRRRRRRRTRRRRRRRRRRIQIYYQLQNVLLFKYIIQDNIIFRISLSMIHLFSYIKFLVYLFSDPFGFPKCSCLHHSLLLILFCLILYRCTDILLRWRAVGNMRTWSLSRTIDDSSNRHTKESSSTTKETRVSIKGKPPINEND